MANTVRLSMIYKELFLYSIIFINMHIMLIRLQETCWIFLFRPHVLLLAHVKNIYYKVNGRNDEISYYENDSISTQINQPTKYFRLWPEYPIVLHSTNATVHFVYLFVYTLRSSLIKN